jgi:transposase
VSNVLKEEKKQQIVALGRLGWSLRRIEREVEVRRETISAYLKEAGIALRLPRGRLLPAKLANDVAIDPVAPKPASPAEQVTPEPCADAGRPAMAAPESPPQKPSHRCSASICEPHREIIQAELSKGRNAKAIWQDLVDHSGFAGGYQSVKRFVRGLLGKSSPEAVR